VGTSQSEITGIAYHTQRVDKGFLFAALRGLEVDGHRFHRGSHGSGGRGRRPGGRSNASRQRDDDSRSQQSSGAGQGFKQFLREPFFARHTHRRYRDQWKTTTTYLLESILEKAGTRVGVIGTINYRYGGKVIPAPNTTPEVPGSPEDALGDG